jgi:hypothetical protein
MKTNIIQITFEESTHDGDHALPSMVGDGISLKKLNLLFGCFYRLHFTAEKCWYIVSGGNASAFEKQR